MPGPRRSHGCYRCRTKKVKCDEERPQCKRCISIGLPCPGYRPENELVFLDMNQRVEHKVLTGREKHKVPRSQSQSSSIVFRTRDQPPALPNKNLQSQSPLDTIDENYGALVKNPKGPILYKSVSTNWQDRALCRFFSDYTVNTDDLSVSPGFLHNLPRLCGRVTTNASVLRQAVMAVALSNFSNQVGSENLLIQARRCYGRGLVELHRALSEGRLESDETLGGCLMLNMYEMFSGDKPLKSVWETHGDALGMLLRVRGTSSQFTSPDCGGITRGAHRVIMFKNLLTRTTPGLESRLWEESMDTNSPWSQAHLALNRIAHLLPVADKVLRDQTSVGVSGETVLRTIGSLSAEDQLFEAWSMRYGTLSSQSALPGNFDLESSIYDSFANSSFNVYRAGRIVLLQTLLNLANGAVLHENLVHVSEEMHYLQIYTSKELSAMVNDISISTAFILADMKGKTWTERYSQDGTPIQAYTSVFPLKVALSVKSLSPEQRDYVSGQLQGIERALGLKTAETIRTTD